MYMKFCYLFITFVIYLLEGASGKGNCNEVFCASVVSKCMLTQACKCNISRDKEKCTCCVDCAKCLGRYYQRCCSCLEMCDSEVLELDPNDSQVGDFSDPFKELFTAVTSEGEPLLDGLVFTYPADLAIDELAKKHHKSKYLKEAYKNDAMPLPRMGVNCTVAFMKQCHSASKCREQCKSIGSGSYRFFFNGCCECVGPTCLNYGIAESKCPLCSNLNDDDYYDQHYMGDDPSSINDVENDFIL
ncbi:UNVERIFIED_CONTAM: hypothetical protein RMT77_006585 [Armadillidium vulgare]|nr:Protein twisted gastrulation [Armadillidium vulgare]